MIWLCMFHDSTLSNLLFSAWFFDLAGGTTEYVVTIASIIGKSRMKGEKLITHLLPYGAEKPRGGMVKEADGNPGTNQIEIFWEPPRGDFTKYVLHVTKLLNTKTSVPDLHTLPPSFQRLNSTVSRSSGVPYNPSSAYFQSNHNIDDLNPTIYNINNKLRTYTILGLQPGEKYEVALETETGGKKTRHAIYDVILTKPMPPRNVSVSSITTTSCKLTWQHPEGSSCLVGYQVLVKSGSDIKTDYSLLKINTSYIIKNLSAGKEYDICLTTVCNAKRQDYGGDETRKTESTPITVEVVTLLEKVRNLTLESSSPEHLVVKWDPESVSPNMQYKVTITSYKDFSWKMLFPRHLNNFPIDKNDGEDEPDNQDLTEIQKLENFKVEKTISGEEKSHKFADFLSGIGSGFPYEVQIISYAKMSKENKEKEAFSEPETNIFFTKPYPPSNIRIDDSIIRWDPSRTTHVSEYHVSWEVISNDEKILKEERGNIKKISVNEELRINPCFRISDLIDKKLEAAKVVKIIVAAVVEIPKLNQKIPLKDRRSLEASERFQVNEDGDFERYIDEQASMVP